ncbi:hypothetical protein GHT06_018753 [Daphnia sinensis]|uniref:Uncharacterized protein n=1 Tax=Daphnia sinensis TaxID=1820382 RepID=A0AAD5KNM8_9CRUS|nr:hypothetical protein GHT06_018753 [Daphnia sinensis]
MADDDDERYDGVTGRPVCVMCMQAPATGMSDRKECPASRWRMSIFRTISMMRMFNALFQQRENGGLFESYIG